MNYLIIKGVIIVIHSLACQQLPYILLKMKAPPTLIFEKIIFLLPDCLVSSGFFIAFLLILVYDHFDFPIGIASPATFLIT